MANRHSLGLGTALAVVLIVAATNTPLWADDNPATSNNSGFDPATRQINSGGAIQPSSQSTDVANMPTPDEAAQQLRERLDRDRLGEPLLQDITKSPVPRSRREI